MKATYEKPCAFVVDVHVEASVCSPLDGAKIKDYGVAIEDEWF